MMGWRPQALSGEALKVLTRIIESLGKMVNINWILLSSTLLDKSLTCVNSFDGGHRLGMELGDVLHNYLSGRVEEKGIVEMCEITNFGGGPFHQVLPVTFSGLTIP